MRNRGHEPLSGEGVCFVFGDVAQGLDLNSVRLQKELQFGEHGPRNVSTAAAATGLDSATFGVAPDGTTRTEPAWRGLVVSLLTYTSRELRVKWAGELLFSVHLGSDLRKMGWIRMRIAVTATGLGLWYDGVRYLTDAPLPGWEPMRNWAWGFGASTSRATDHHWCVAAPQGTWPASTLLPASPARVLTCLLRPHAHRVDNFQVTSAWLAAAAASYPVHLTLNRQEYYPTNQSFSYRRPPVVSAVLPASGPLAGGTRVVITGTNLGGGTHYKCRFGGVPPGLVPPRGSEPLAQFITDAELLGADADADAALIPLPFGATFGASRVACFAPNASVVGDAVVTLELSLNGQDYTADGVSFTRHAPGLDRIYPSSGPHLGFAVELSGADLANGTRYRCRFQALHLAPAERVVADAALDVAAVAGGREGAHGAVACTVPTGLLAVVHDVSVSLNAQQFTPSGWVDGLQGEVTCRSSNSVYLVVNCTGEAPVAWARICTGPTQ